MKEETQLCFLFFPMRDIISLAADKTRHTGAAAEKLFQSDDQIEKKRFNAKKKLQKSVKRRV